MVTFNSIGFVDLEGVWICFGVDGLDSEGLGFLAVTSFSSSSSDERIILWRLVDFGVDGFS